MLKTRFFSNRQSFLKLLEFVKLYLLFIFASIQFWNVFKSMYVQDHCLQKHTAEKNKFQCLLFKYFKPQTCVTFNHSALTRNTIVFVKKLNNCIFFAQKLNKNIIEMKVLHGILISQHQNRGNLVASLYKIYTDIFLSLVN